MNTNSAYLSVVGIDIDVIYKDIKNLHIGVYPPWGRVRVAAPTSLNDDQVRLAVIHRLPWIKRQRDRYRSADRMSKREMISGESHYVWGERRRLKVVEGFGRPHLELAGNQLLLHVTSETNTSARLMLLDRWLRAELRAVIPGHVVKWEPILGVSVQRWGLRRMKTKWGSCNPSTRHLWFNVELAKKNPMCTEYIVVHEMAHLRARGHGEPFTQLMDRILPDWKRRRDELNGAPLSHFTWAWEATSGMDSTHD